METPEERHAVPGTGLFPLNAAQCETVLKVGRAVAHRMGSHRDEIADLADDFLVNFAGQCKQKPDSELTLALYPASLVRCAERWMRHALRAQRLLQSRETAWPSDAEEGETPRRVEFPAQAPYPEAEAIRTELRQRIAEAIIGAHLSPDQEALLASLLAGEGAVTIAPRLGCTPAAIRQRIKTLRVRLRAVHLLAGIGDAEIDDYLSVLNAEWSLR